MPVHLYLNGQYWGLYQLEQRINDDFAAEALGGGPNGYDIVKHGPPVTEIEDGTAAAWHDLWPLVNDLQVSDAELAVIAEQVDLAALARLHPRAHLRGRDRRHQRSPGEQDLGQQLVRRSSPRRLGEVGLRHHRCRAHAGCPRPRRRHRRRRVGRIAPHGQPGLHRRPLPPRLAARSARHRPRRHRALFRTARGSDDDRCRRADTRTSARPLAGVEGRDRTRRDRRVGPMGRRRRQHTPGPRRVERRGRLGRAGLVPAPDRDRPRSASPTSVWRIGSAASPSRRRSAPTASLSRSGPVP